MPTCQKHIHGTHTAATAFGTSNSLLLSFLRLPTLAGEPVLVPPVALTARREGAVALRERFDESIPAMGVSPSPIRDAADDDDTFRPISSTVAGPDKYPPDLSPLLSPEALPSSALGLFFELADVDLLLPNERIVDPTDEW